MRMSHSQVPLYQSYFITVMIVCNLKNAALDREILFQRETPFILLGMELSLSKRVYIVS